ncbi:aminoglycoside phosphotransferase [Oerskovia turbata]|uniref:Aminoglycoside phosphotransferase n=1 Tax=Oerskovia turbata TaxID=1713 RepID=A0A4Q1L0J2_9CELL|nr:phosphotransferase [Oerskovia turbata]RXR27292.1 aminoglycoside phosphotransferase [Oerskovia turbata]RXR36134.1 aminoglycoside phosphotransferase [Oerskovia turbata]
MPRSPLNLAALATAAVPGLDVRSVRPSEATGDDDVAIVTDSGGQEWVVRAPRTLAAGAALEAETALLDSLRHYVTTGVLSFTVPDVLGYALLPEGGRAVVHHRYGGVPLDLDTLRPGPGLAADLGRVLAAVHELPHSVVENAGLPVYTAAEYRDRRLAEVDEAAKTGRVPARLLRRWEAALEDVSLWKYQPVVVHGDLGTEQVLVARGRVVAITDWAEARVADPADDLAWLLVAAPPEAIDSIMEAYQLRRTELTDPHLTDRALLAGELALARWLLHGVRHGLQDVIDDAVDMLIDLDEATSGENEG